MGKATDAAWYRWFAGWWASFWDPSDLPGLEIIALLHDRVMTGDVRLAGELRLQMAGYGLTPAGRLSLRWAPPKPAEPTPADEPATDGPYRHLRALPDEPKRKAGTE